MVNMKKLVFIAAITLAACTASPALADTYSEAKDEFCPRVESMSRTIMKSRQIGVPLVTILEAQKSTAPHTDWVKPIMMMAYHKPRYHTEEFKQREIDDFAEEMFLMCMNLEKGK